MQLCVRALIGALLLSMGGAACACSSRESSASDEERYGKASAVFVAHIVRTDETRASVRGSNEPLAIVEGTFRVVEVLKGRPPEDRKIRDLVYGPGNCSLGLLAGIDYLVFLYKDSYVLWPGEAESNFVLWPGGSRPFIDISASEPKRLLEKLRALRK
jgi:hypothetical protein